MSTKLVTRVELLQWLEKLRPIDGKLYRIYHDLKSGIVINLDDWGYASGEYYKARVQVGKGQSQLPGDGSAGDPPQVQVPGEEPGQHSDLPAGDLWLLDNPLLAGTEQVAGDDSEAAVEPGPRVEDSAPPDQTRPRVGSILGAYRLATPSGFVVFVSVQGERGPVVYCGVGLGLPKELSDFDVQRVLEFGKVISFENIKEMLHV